MIDDDELAAFVRENDLLGSDELREAQSLQIEEQRPLYDVLADYGYVDEEPLVEFVAEALNVSVVDLDEYDPSPKTTEQIPNSVALENWVLPLEIEHTDDGDRLVLAMRNPIDMAAMDAVAVHTDADIRPVLAGPESLKEALRETYGTERDEFDLSGMQFSSEVEEQPVFESIEEEDDDLTQFGPPGAKRAFDDPDDNSVHKAQTVEARSDELQERISEIEATRLQPDADEESGEQPSVPSDPDGLGGAKHVGKTSALAERIAAAGGDLDPEQRELLESRPTEEILVAALTALLDSDILSLEDLLAELRNDD